MCTIERWVSGAEASILLESPNLTKAELLWEVIECKRSVCSFTEHTRLHLPRHTRTEVVVSDYESGLSGAHKSLGHLWREGEEGQG